MFERGVYAGKVRGVLCSLGITQQGPSASTLTLQRALVHLVHQHVADSQQRGVPRQAPQQDAGGAEQQARVAGGGSV